VIKIDLLRGLTQKFYYVILPCRIEPINWVVLRIEILMQCLRVDRLAVFRISRKKPSGERVEVSSTQIVQTQIKVILFTATVRGMIEAAARVRGGFSAWTIP
jgi:hypothetical protein